MTDKCEALRIILLDAEHGVNTTAQGCILMNPPYVKKLLAERDELREALEAVEVGYRCGHDLSLVIDQVRAALSQSE